MRQNFPVQLKLKVTLHLDRYLERPDQDQPNSWRQALMVALPKQAGVYNFKEHRYLSLLATLSKWMMRVFVERMRQHPRPGVHETCPQDRLYARLADKRSDRHSQGSVLARTQMALQRGDGEYGHSPVL